jgi:hypothetical protein
MKERGNSLRERGGNKFKGITANKKAQVWSMDFVASLVMFLLVLIPLLFVWNYMNIQNAEQRTFDEIETLALKVSDSLIRTKGIPENWNSSNVNVIGLTKVSEFIYMGNNEYTLTKNILVGTYDFFFSVTDLNGTSYGTIGSKSADKTIVPVERYCLYNERVVKMELALIG